jgi:hypothetical protein
MGLPPVTLCDIKFDAISTAAAMHTYAAMLIAYRLMAYMLMAYRLMLIANANSQCLGDSHTSYSL